MDTFYVLSIQSSLSLVVFALIARWHVAPWLARLPLNDALIPLLWIHVFRYTPLTLFAPGQVDPSLPRAVADTIAYGDLISGVLALFALLAVRYKAGPAIPLVWLFSIIGIGDVVYATLKGVTAELYKYPLGWNWYILNYYVPMLVVTHVMIITRLIKRTSAASP